MSVQASLDQQWARISGRLKDEVGETAYRSWLKPLTVEDFIGGQVRIVVPTRFMRDWIRTHYADRIRALWTGENPGVQSVEIVVAPPRGDASLGGALSTLPRGAANGLDAGPLADGATVPLPAYDDGDAGSSLNGAAEAPALPAFIAGNGLGEERDDVSALLDPRFTFENFVVGKPNELAFAAARRVADASAVTFNPLFLYGGVGLGKTHLMHAIAWHIRKKDPARRVIYLSAEKFMYQFIRALRYKDTMAFKEQFRSVDVLMIDDVQFISGKDSTQEEFFHTFNALVDQNRQVIISADKSPSDLEGMEERLRSRLGWGLVADIHPTTYELRLGILQSKAEQMRVQIPQKVLEFLAHKITSNVRELEGALNRIVAHAELVGRAITLESSQEVLHDLLRASNRRVTIEEIQKKVAEHYNIRLADMSSARRARAVARPRQVAMYLSKQLTARSLPEIGRKFGDRDHTTVMHAVRKVEELCATDPTFFEDVELLRRMLEG
ncbi:chromosomal replication initiator protein DnaA [Nitrospirillum sp. BR 11828]|uniref:chromosomal replication initiator protein DnaA n=1 Tax=Nitrospirillum sp. BR 11828 TaxID=3104325 RepID=UPI002ACAD84B|nr:chromosomal replication initiator protein DnaA [Nitrospirillum sp. BR 11828]MDZ5646936.1 chromosomal replication initiator protein DnaA [Nitrospirillum sp. BR 11828]